jgi:hypothetical protein
MELPHRYSYRPRWGTVLGGALFFAGCSGFMAYMAHHNSEGLSTVPIALGSQGASLFYWAVAVLAALFVVMALALAVRRLANPKFLELGHDTLALPQQRFFQVRIERVPYREIERVWEGELSGQAVLYVSSGGRRLVIAPSLLSDRDSYIAIRDFLCLHARYQEQKPCA